MDFEESTQAKNPLHFIMFLILIEKTLVASSCNERACPVMPLYYVW
jgi:hypothetical protein